MSTTQEPTENNFNVVDMGTATARLLRCTVENFKRLTSNPYESDLPDACENAYGFNFQSDNRTFDSGAKRDSAAGKPRPDLLSPFATMRRGRVMELGARKYGERNWEKGMPLSVFAASANRHFIQFMAGDTDEDHLAHCAFNLDAIMHGQEMIKRGIWPAEYNDLPDYTSPLTAKFSFGDPRENGSQVL
jgi:hypothetical protein